jgi:hypothetical protein
MNNITLIHVTSSIYRDQILEKGLLPSRFSKKDVEECIQALLPNENINCLLSQVLNAKCGASALIRGRLDKNPELAFMSETSMIYYNNICDCVQDGGEFYTAVRLSLEFVTGNKIPCPYPEAFPIVCRVNLKYFVDSEEVTHVVIPNSKTTVIVPDLKEIEVSFKTIVPPSELTIIEAKLN